MGQSSSRIRQLCGIAVFTAVSFFFISSVFAAVYGKKYNSETGRGDWVMIDAPSDGNVYGRKDGTWAVPTGGAHDAVSLSTDLGNNLLGLSTQQLTLDNQSANKVFAGPATGAAAAPAFRSLVAGDVPDLSGTYSVTGHNHTGVYQPADADLTSIAGGVTGIVKGGGNGNGYSAASAGTDYVVPAGSITGSAAKLSISGKTGLLSFTGLNTTNRVKTIRDAADTILELGGSYTPTGTWNWGSATWSNVPTLNQNTSGTASNVSGTPALPNGTTATTQSAADNSTKLATTAYVDTGLGGKQASDTDLTSLAGGITGIVKGAGNGGGYSAASAGSDYQSAITNDTNVAGMRHRWRVSIVNPNAVVTASAVIPIGEVDANITVTKIVATTSSSSYEIAGDLKYADARIGLANATVVNDFDTSSGARTDTTITSASIASGKFAYLSFDSAPNASMTDCEITIYFDYD